MPPGSVSRRRPRRTPDVASKLAAQRSKNLRPMRADRHVDRHRGRKEGNGEEECGSQMSHSFIPLLIHNRSNAGLWKLIP